MCSIDVNRNAYILKPIAKSNIICQPRSVVLSFCSSVDLPFGRSTIVRPSRHLPVLSFCHSVVLLFCCSVVLSFYRSIVLSFNCSPVLLFCCSVVLQFCSSAILSFFVGVARRKRNLVSIYRRSDITSQRLAEDLILTNHIRHLPAEQNVLPYILLLQYLLYNLRTPKKLQNFKYITVHTLLL